MKMKSHQEDTTSQTWYTPNNKDNRDNFKNFIKDNKKVFTEKKFKESKRKPEKDINYIME